jgi:hypothetical protein
MKHVISAAQRCDQGMGFVLYDSKGKPRALFPNELKMTRIDSWSLYIAVMNKLFASCIFRQASAQRNR